MIKRLLLKNALAFLILGSIINPLSAEESPARCMELDSIEKMYDSYDLSTWSLFAGGFINFGYWNLQEQEKELTTADRVDSQKNLYRHVLQKLEVSPQDTLLEVGCGLGLGSALALEEFDPQEIYAIDFSSAQIDRAHILNQPFLESHRLSFQVSRAEALPFQNNTFEDVFSIEAAQHFSSMEAFLAEAYRVLKPQGKLAVATFFATTLESPQRVATLIKTVHDNLDTLIPIEKVQQLLQEAGFKNITIESIGERVWAQFDQWIAQGEFKETWNRNWYKAYQQRWLDYYVVVAEKASPCALHAQKFILGGGRLARLII